LAVTEDDVIWCYQSLLGRAPESREAVQKLVAAADIRALVLLFLASPEYQKRNARHALVPLSEGQMDVEVTASTAEMLRLQDRIRAAWTHLGEARPHHSVLTADEYLAESINDRSIEQFYQSGEPEAATIDAILKRYGFPAANTSTCVEYGCGLGRVTFSLAKRFGMVHGYDISSNHIAMAKQRALDRAVRNVQFHLCAADVGYQALEQCDFFFSCIVFQHNPPPIIRAMISSSLRSLREGGMAIFQVPTFKAGYRFHLQGYLATPRGLDIEMHCIPQQTVFEIVADEGCQVLEVREDDRVGHLGEWISNTFVVRRLSQGQSRK
jgi:SAM-dependent methyltransferase